MLRTLMILTAIVVVAPMWAQDVPDAPGKDTTVRICTACHGAEMWAGAHKSSGDWDQTITSMTEKGLSINDADYATVLDYLSKNLGTAPPKVNINKAMNNHYETVREEMRGKPLTSVIEAGTQRMQEAIEKYMHWLGSAGKAEDHVALKPFLPSLDSFHH